MSNFRALKISRKLDITRKIKFLITSLVVLYSQNHTTGIRGHYYESSDCFEYPKKSLLKSRHPKKLANISYPKNPRNRKFQTPKNPRYPPPPRGTLPPSQFPREIATTLIFDWSERNERERWIKFC